MHQGLDLVPNCQILVHTLHSLSNQDIEVFGLGLEMGLVMVMGALSANFTGRTHMAMAYKTLAFEEHG
jgi:hypothetical protein